MSKIKLTENERRELSRLYGCSKGTLSLALNFRLHSKRALEIRQHSINHLNGMLIEQ